MVPHPTEPSGASADERRPVNGLYSTGLHGATVRQHGDRVLVCTERVTETAADAEAPGEFVRDVTARVPEGWRGALGARPPEEVLTGRLAGNVAGGVICILGGISATRFVAQERDNKGWWPRVVGHGLPVDLDRVAVFGFDWPPVDPQETVILTPADQARLLAILLDEAGIVRLDGLIGCSYGGMVALEFARQFPERAARLGVIAASHRPSVMGGAWRGVQRRILEFAISAGRPEEGVSLARQLAMTTYRAPEEFTQRFNPVGAHDPRYGATSEVCGYLMSRGESYVAKMSAQRFLSLSASVDLHDVKPEEISTPAMLVATSTDWLNPPSDARELADRLAGPVAYRIIDSPCGHDAFLVEQESIAAILTEFQNDDWIQ